MKILLLILVLLAASLAPPTSRSAHRRARDFGPQVSRHYLRPIRVLRTPQGPKVVRPLGGARS
ncbi:hypothetical protein HHL22_05560 [Hymenobacter sp. RP-2-7]|uniref:Uncharacterized protein n=1 Tax=Hymenobacter polaris TaxID=2682546 RepID=A0A7Y0ACH9_9BACT|nr:hypothetical protein [Hymenobacter polaris]NML64667.1 hypothetical protein [Hymenobacter polaris]